MSGLKEKDLAFVRFQGEANDQHCLPYFLAIDHGDPKHWCATAELLPYCWRQCDRALKTTGLLSHWQPFMSISHQLVPGFNHCAKPAAAHQP